MEREGLPKRDRSLITAAALAALGETEQLRFHRACARDDGVTDAEVRLACSAGWPNGMAATAMRKELVVG